MSQAGTATQLLRGWVFRDANFDGWQRARRIHEISTERNTILGGSTMAVYQPAWDASE
ncbi:MAG: hypothetical protein L0177_05540 [Chloroflexi bacterium]|nr:hypothetical protein [Chloroflexota bacterium]